MSEHVEQTTKNTPKKQQNLPPTLTEEDAVAYESTVAEARPQVGTTAGAAGAPIDPAVFRPQTVLQLQRTIGNQAVWQLLQRGAPRGGSDAKRILSRPGDPVGVGRGGQSAGGIVQRTIAEFIPEAAFVEDERGRLSLFTETIPASSVVRRHDPFADLIDPFIEDLNEWVPTTWLIGDSVERLAAALERGGVMSPDPERALTDRDREVLARARDSETLDALREVEGASVDDRLHNVERAINELRAARHELESAEAQLDARQAALERGEAEGEIAEIEATKEQIKAAYTVATTIITTLAAGPAATAAAITAQVQARIASAPTDILGAVVDMAFEDQLSDLRSRVRRLTEREESAITLAIQAQVSAAMDHINASEADGRVAATQLQNAIAGRAGQFTSLGSRIDDTVSDDDSMTRYQVMFRISAAVQETSAIVDHSFRMVDELPGIRNFMSATRRGTYLGIPGTGPREFDTGQEITFRHLQDVVDYAEWLADMQGHLRYWSQQWREVTESVGGVGNPQPEY